MSTPFIGRLRASNYDLKSSNPQLVQDAYDVLFELWLEYSEDQKFINSLNQIIKENPNILPEFSNRLNRLHRSEDEKAVLLERFILLYPAKISQEFQVQSKAIKKPVITPRIFISYSHKDETYKDELVTILTPLQDEGILEIWQDREIIPGDEWYEAIQAAMNSCNLALLLISGDFLASRFIRDKELTRLFQRRKEEGLRVVPIIIRSCKWQSVPVLKGIQALPKDGKPVVSFRDVGERDHIWTEIATAIESLC